MLSARHQDWVLLLLRVVIAAIFILHGSMKWSFWAGAPADMPASMLTIMKILSVVEPLAGLAVLLGAFTCWAAGALAVIMVGAIFLKLAVMKVAFADPTGKMGWEFDALILAGNLVLMTVGAGAYSLDAMRRK